MANADLRRRAVVLLICLLCAAPGAGWPAFGEAPLTAHGSALVVDATLNGRLDGRFLLDTGATYCVVSMETARKALIRDRVGGRKLRLLTAAGPIEATLGIARTLEVGGVSARDVEVAIVDEDPAPGLVGILGLSFLGRFSYTVDSREKVLRLKR